VQPPRRDRADEATRAAPRIARRARRAGAAALVAGVVGSLLGGGPAAQAAPVGDGAATARDDDRTSPDGPPAVWPRPQSLRASGPFVPVGPEAVLVAAADTDPHALETVRSVLRGAGARTVFEVTPEDPLPGGGPVVRVGPEAAGSALIALRAPAEGDLPAGGYRLAAGELDGRGTVALSGVGPDGLFHAAQTLRQLVTSSGGERGFAGVTVRDWPTTPVRGVTEGFYGTPWTQRERLDTLEFLGRTKQNRYLYAPGGDPYRTAAHWRDPYPADRREDFRALARHAARNHVVLGWAVSPGQSLCFADAGDRRALLRKLDAMRALGVRAFQLRFDDVSYEEWHCGDDADRYGTGPGAAARAQAELAGAVAAHLEAHGPRTAPLSVLPTEFYQEGRTAYRAALARALDDRVEVAWTGVGVVPRTITGGELAGARAAFPRHRLVTLDNYPVNDYAPERLFFGPYRGREPAVASGSAALLANAMEQPAASRIPLFTTADFAWNPRGYAPGESWSAAVDALAGPDPRAREAVRVLAGNGSSSILGGRESAYLRPLLDRFWSAYEAGDRERLDGAAGRLRDAFAAMRRAPEHVPSALADETGPWLRQLARLGEAGERAVDMLLAQSRGDGAAAWRDQLAVRGLAAEVRRSGATVGEGVLPAFLDRALETAGEWAGVRRGAFGGERAHGGPPGEDGAGVHRAADGHPGTAYRARTAPAGPVPRGRGEVPAPAREVTVELPRPRALEAVTVLTGPGSGTRAHVEARLPGGGWERLGGLSASGWTHVAGRGLRADALRLRWQEGTEPPVVHEITPWYADVPAARLSLSREEADAATGGAPARITAALDGVRPADVRERLEVDAPEGFTVRAPSRVTVPRGATASARIEIAAEEDVRPGTYRVPVTFAGQRRTVTVRAFPPTGGPDLARGGRAKSSGDETDDFPASAVTDGADGTRWSSPPGDRAWVEVELARPARVGEVRLHWQDAYARAYDVEVSADGRNWTTAARVREGRGGREQVRMDAPADTGFVRVRGVERATRFGYSLWSLEVYAVRDDRERKPEDGSGRR
jgi:hyaluronoglucosaminidase